MGLGRNGMGESNFERVAKASSLLPIVEDRLPKSCNIYNMVQNHPKFQNEMNFYIWKFNKVTPNSNAWILATYIREDYGTDINISAPKDLSRSLEFKEALLKSDIIRWDAPFIFAATDLEIVPIIQKSIIEVTGKTPLPSINQMFYTTAEYHPIPAHFNLESTHVELKSLDSQIGAKFLVDNWPYAKTGSLAYVKKLIERNGSAGVYVNGQLVAGAALNGSGMITMLHTLAEHRNKGYGQLCMSYFISVLLEHHLIPCCTVEMHNEASLGLQHKIGLRISHQAAYVSRSLED